MRTRINMRITIMMRLYLDASIVGSRQKAAGNAYDGTSREILVEYDHSWDKNNLKTMKSEDKENK